MKPIPKISIIGSGIRVNLWKSFYKNLSENNDLDFEIIFTGHVTPNFELPKNFIFNYSETKPAQCVEISARSASGDLVMISSDDVIFNDHFLDNIYKHYIENCSAKDAVSASFQRRGYEYATEDYQFWPGIDNSPMMPMNAVFKRTLWHDLGGIDINFIGLFYDLDLTLRLLENGGKTFFCKESKTEEIFPEDQDFLAQLRRKISTFLGKKEKPSSLYEEIGRGYDKPTLERFWLKSLNDIKESDDYYAINGDKAHMKKRLYAVESFTNESIVKYSQGPKGRWV